jgi:uncharacterized protein
MIVEETIATIQERYGEALKDITVERLVIGVFFTGVKLSNGCGGISYTPTADIHGPRGSASMFPEKRRVRFKGTSVHDILAMADSAPLFNTVKIVLLNALSGPIMSGGGYRVVNAGDALDMIDMGTIRKAAMVGAISPILRKLKEKGGIEIHVIERKKESLHGDVALYAPPEDAPRIIPLCDTVIITGASIANGTIDGLLSYTQPAARVIVVGPTASFLPDAFFKRNVDILCGVKITKPDLALDMLGEGMSALDLFGECVEKINILNVAGGRVS